jgi:hypothetical protein
MCNVEYKKSIIESTLASAKLYYDDRLKNIEQQQTSQDESPKVNNFNVNTNASSAAVSSTSGNNGMFFGIKKRLSLKKASGKDKQKNTLQELKIKEDTDKESEEQLVSDLNGTSETLNQNSEENDEYDDDFDFFSAQMSPGEIATHLVNKIDRKVQLLDRLWQELNRQSLNYSNMLLNFYKNLQLLSKSFDVVSQKLNENEQLANRIGGTSISEIEGDQLADELEKVKAFQLKISSYQPLIDNMCTHYASIMQDLHNSNSVFLKNMSAQNVRSEQRLNSIGTKFDDLNLRWSNLQNQLQENYLHIYSLIESSGADIFLKLADSVQSPWQRGISANKMPYYIK